MNNPTIILQTGLRANSQIPTDSKTYFATLAQLQNLGSNNFNALAYYDGMIVTCAETQLQYIWREQSNFESGILNEPYVYPNGLIVNGITYSNKRYNFFEYKKINLNNELLINGGVVAYIGPGLTYLVSTAEIYDETEIPYYIEETEFILSDADPANDRFDLIVIDLESQLFEVIEGTPSANPQTPYFNTDTTVLLSIIRVSAGIVEGEAVKTIIYDENLSEAGGEYNVSSSKEPPIVFLGADSNSHPGIITQSGNKTILYNQAANNLGDNAVLFFGKADDTIVEGITQFVFSLRTKAPFDLDSRLEIFMIDNNGQLISNVIDIFENVPLNFNTTNFQTIVIPFEDFNTSDFRQIVFRMEGFKDEIFIDNIYMLAGQANIPETIPDWIYIQGGAVHKADGNYDLNNIQHGDTCIGINVNNPPMPGLSVLAKGIFNSTKGSGNPLNADSYDRQPFIT